MSIPDGGDEDLRGIANSQLEEVPSSKSLEDHVLQMARREPRAVHRAALSECNIKVPLPQMLNGTFEADESAPHERAVLVVKGQGDCGGANFSDFERDSQGGQVANFERVQQETATPESPEETVEVVSLAPRERVQQQIVEHVEDEPQSPSETIEAVAFPSREQVQQRIDEKFVKAP